jgi:transposase InsO family protein
MKHVQWLWSGLAWSMDATEYGPEGCQLIPVQDLASRYRLRPLVTDRLNGRQIACHLEDLFRQHGAPLLLKRDNGSPFNHHAIDQLMARYCVLPLNNPPHYPPYNGAMEKGIGDLKRCLDQRWGQPATVPPHWAVTVETTVHELNHRSRRSLKGRTPCACFHDPARHLRWNRRQRQKIFRLLYQEFWRRIENMVNRNHHTLAAAWRSTVETWLRCQGLITIRHRPNKKVSTTFPQFWSHN